MKYLWTIYNANYNIDTTPLTFPNSKVQESYVSQNVKNLRAFQYIQVDIYQGIQ